jgi:hypothetical protein
VNPEKDLLKLDAEEKDLVKIVFLYFFELMGLNLRNSKSKNEQNEGTNAAKKLLEITV